MSKAVLSTLVFLFDLSALVFAWAGGFLLRFNFDVPDNFARALWWGLVLLLPAHAVACRLAGLYRGIWLFASLPDLKRVLWAVGLSYVSGSKKIILFIILLLLGSCRGTRYLQENQKLLDKQSIEAPKGINKSALSDLYVQKANRRLLGLPINSLVWMHHEGEKRYNQQTFIDKKTKVEARVRSENCRY